MWKNLIRRREEINILNICIYLVLFVEVIFKGVFHRKTDLCKFQELSLFFMRSFTTTELSAYSEGWLEKDEIIFFSKIWTYINFKKSILSMLYLSFIWLNVGNISSINEYWKQHLPLRFWYPFLSYEAHIWRVYARSCGRSISNLPWCFYHWFVASYKMLGQCFSKRGNSHLVVGSALFWWNQEGRDESKVAYVITLPLLMSTQKDQKCTAVESKLWAFLVCTESLNKTKKQAMFTL